MQKGKNHIFSKDSYSLEILKNWKRKENKKGGKKKIGWKLEFADEKNS